MKLYVLAALLSALFILLGAAPASAHCPLCTAATGAGVAAARFYGVDDAITGLWIGAFVISTALWFDRLLKKKYSVPFQAAVLSASALALTVVPFYFAGLFGSPIKIFGIDRLLFGIITGSVLTFAGTEISIWIKNTRGNILFSYQTIILVVGILAATSFIFQYIIRNSGVLG